jgi:hypothetical protein
MTEQQTKLIAPRQLEVNIMRSVHKDLGVLAQLAQNALHELNADIGKAMSVYGAVKALTDLAKAPSHGMNPVLAIELEIIGEMASIHMILIQVCHAKRLSH